MKKIILFFAIALAGLFFISCEDEPPTIYLPKNYIEAFLLVGEPIEGLRILQTQPIEKEYSYENAAIKDAQVIIKVDGEIINLIYKNGDNPGYADPNGHIVKAEKLYEIEVIFADGTKAFGKTFTPKSFNWIKEPKDILQFPLDTLKMPGIDSLRIEWEPASSIGFYFLSVKCLDTLNYGKYLNPQTDELNRRTFGLFNEHEPNYYENKSWIFMANTETPTVWASFKWFGPQLVEVYAPDFNFFRWFIQLMDFTGGSEYDPLLTSVEGNAIGVFGSASVIRKESLLLKNKP